MHLRILVVAGWVGPPWRFTYTPEEDAFYCPEGGRLGGVANQRVAAALGFH